MKEQKYCPNCKKELLIIDISRNCTQGYDFINKELKGKGYGDVNYECPNCGMELDIWELGIEEPTIEEDL